MDQLQTTNNKCKTSLFTTYDARTRTRDTANLKKRRTRTRLYIGHEF